MLYAEEEKTLARVATFLPDPQRSFAATLQRMMTTNHLAAARPWLTAVDCRPHARGLRSSPRA
ncbi:hypothetical protein MESS2_760145 [Mesorhizobium metallidurans STM 2683]|uniref:Uncharacterized protein n=1 Tax=Mesorhizobium metallidurans STM 2683 TaxID=1297569 RepID=M5EXA9_9HYPH|nr:hypothetical protein MESS2_760145 [Mesorhizobium metallidurans STM 2683]